MPAAPTSARLLRLLRLGRSRTSLKSSLRSASMRGMVLAVRGGFLRRRLRPASARSCGARAYSGAGKAVRKPVLRKPGTYAVFLFPCAPSPRHESTSLAPLGRAPPRPLSPAHSLVSWLSPSPEPSSLCLSSISSFCLNLAVNLDSVWQVPETSL